jgi:ATP-binding cassette subfamily C (CFTR/MRP) protein 1
VAIAAAYGSPFFVAVGLKIIQDLLAFAQPQFLRWLLSYIEVYQAAFRANAETPDPVQGFAIVILMFTAALVQIIALHQVSWITT